jgi:hypothetical protein
VRPRGTTVGGATLSIVRTGCSKFLGMHHIPNLSNHLSLKAREDLSRSPFSTCDGSWREPLPCLARGGQPAPFGCGPAFLICRSHSRICAARLDSAGTWPSQCQRPWGRSKSGEDWGVESDRPADATTARSFVNWWLKASSAGLDLGAPKADCATQPVLPSRWNTGGNNGFSMIRQ